MIDYEVLYLKKLVADGARWRYGENVPPEVIDRINLEYDVIIPNTIQLNKDSIYEMEVEE